MRRTLSAICLAILPGILHAQRPAPDLAIVDGLPPVTVQLSETDRALIRDLTDSINRAIDLANQYGPELPAQPPPQIDPPAPSDPSEPAPPSGALSPVEGGKPWPTDGVVSGVAASQTFLAKHNADSGGSVILLPANLNNRYRSATLNGQRPDRVNINWDRETNQSTRGSDGRPNNNGIRRHLRWSKQRPAATEILEVRLTAPDEILRIRVEWQRGRQEGPLRNFIIGSSAAPSDPQPGPSDPPAPSAQFKYIPGQDSVTIIIPPGIEHYQFHVFSRRKHVALYGPDRSGSGRYVIPMSPARLQAAARAAGETDGSIMAYVNTTKLYPDARGVTCGKQVGWRIMNPLIPQSGDGDRLLCGEDR